MMRWFLRFLVVALATALGGLAGIGLAEALFSKPYAREDFGWALIGMFVTGPIGALAGLSLGTKIAVRWFPPPVVENPVVPSGRIPGQSVDDQPGAAAGGST